MLAIAFLTGGLAGWLITHEAVGSLVGAVIAAGAAIAIRPKMTAAFARKARLAEPVDLAAEAPARLTPESYAALPLEVRNAVVVRLVGEACGMDPEAVVPLLPNLLGRTRALTRSDWRTKQAILAATRPTPPEKRKILSAVCQGELILAARASIPTGERAREFTEKSLGAPANEKTMEKATLDARLGPRSVAQMIDDAVAGTANFAFVVGTIRRVGEFHARQLAKMR
jgi:hypothetical protein